MPGPGRPAPATALDDAWALTERISPRRSVRVADVDPATGRPVNVYSSTRPTRGPRPDVPWAVPLADTAGCYRLLGLDLDTRRAGPAAVLADLADVVALLDELDVAHVVCASGPGGGRHVWAALPGGAPAAQVARLARALRRRLPTLDTAPLCNPAAGCLRPPGAPHRAGGTSTVLAGDLRTLVCPAGPGDVAARLLTLLGADDPPAPADEEDRAAGLAARLPQLVDDEHGPHLAGPRRPLPAASARALADGAPDASAALHAVLLGAARARWTLADVAALPAGAPGLAHATSRRDPARPAGPRQPRTTADRDAVLSRQWTRAVARVLATPGTGHDPTFDDRAGALAAHVAAVQTRAGAAPGRWATAGGPADRRVLDGLCSLALHAVRADVAADVRRLALLVGVGRETARTALHRLAADGWLTHAAPSDGPRAAVWALPAVPVQPQQVATPSPDVPSTAGVPLARSQADPRPPSPVTHCNPADRPAALEDDPTPGADARAAWQHRLTTRLTTGTHDTWTSNGLGLAVERTWTALTSSAATTARIATRTGTDPATAARHLHHLHAVHLARPGRQAGTWERGPGTLDDAAARLGTVGTLTARARAYALEQDVWAWWCDELRWRRQRTVGRSGQRPRRLPGLGQGVLGLSALGPRGRHGPYPRRPGGRSDHGGARRQLRLTRPQAVVLE